jgi:hypothetical protein
VDIEAKLSNPSGMPGESWVPTYVPPSAVREGQKLDFVTDAGRRFPAVADKPGRVLVCAFFAEGETEMAGHFEAHARANPLMPQGKFQWHPLFADQPPSDVVIKPRNVTRELVPLEIVRETEVAVEATRRVLVEQSGRRYIVQIDQEFYHLSPLSRASLTVLWSDPADPNWYTARDTFEFEAGEPMHILHPAVGATLAQGGDGRFVLTVGGGFRDSTGFVVDVILAAEPDKPEDIALVAQLDAETQSIAITGDETDDDFVTKLLHRGLLSVARAAQGDDPIGLADRATWLRYGGLIPGLPMGLVETMHALDAAALDYGRELNPARAPYGTRKLGLQDVPGGTGDQEDFAAAKGSLLFEADGTPRPMVVRAMVWAAQAEAARGYFYFDPDQPRGEWRHEDHPQHVTWSGQAHWHLGISPDQRGKVGTRSNGADPVPPKPADDQHDSGNWFYMAVQMTRHPALELVAERRAEVDACWVRDKYNQLGAVRGMGRPAQRMALALATTRSDRVATIYKGLLTRLASRIIQAVGESDTNWTAGAQPIGVQGGDPRLRIVDTLTGELRDSVNMWEHGLFAVGGRVALIICERFQLNDAADHWWLLTRQAAWTIVRLGWSDQFEYEVANAHFPRLESVDSALLGITGDGWDAEADYGRPLPTWAFRTSMVNPIGGGGGGVLAWSRAGVSAAADLFSPDEPRAFRIGKVMARIAPSEFRDYRTADWWALSPTARERIAGASA